MSHLLSIAMSDLLPINMSDACIVRLRATSSELLTGGVLQMSLPSLIMLAS
jgi:hypothetical protein